MKIEINHNLSQSQALIRVQEVIRKAKSNYASHINYFDESWIENKGKVKIHSYGFKITGVLTITEKNILINLKLPLATYLYKNQIKSSIINELNTKLTL